ncbi:RHS domain-containing protein [Delftia tsuruhatensis]|uniref:RHS domain-containing protein n=1 Tax=Delftia tsuruhatensis TaxID=180282 RepID=UPI000AC58E9E|nr:RHS domain-containing protein [Delftia tsuruhatensis]
MPIRPNRRPQELTDETGRIVWAASYKVWGQTQQLQYLRTGTNDAAGVHPRLAPAGPGRAG